MNTNYRYQYRYANSTEVGPRQPMQTEFWIPKGRKGGEWRVSVYAPTDGLYKTWRKVRPGHNHADKLAHSIKIKDVASDRTQFDVCQAYCAWARSAGLRTVAVFKGNAHGMRAVLESGLQYAEVDVSEFIGSAPTAEVCDE